MLTDIIRLGLDLQPLWQLAYTAVITGIIMGAIMEVITMAVTIM
jgi:hypothetical protein